MVGATPAAAASSCRHVPRTVLLKPEHPKPYNRVTDLARATPAAAASRREGDCAAKASGDGGTAPSLP